MKVLASDEAIKFRPAAAQFMSWVDRMLDGDESALPVQRSGAVLMLWSFLGFGTLWVLAMLASLVVELVTGDRYAVASTMHATVALLLVLALFTQERYRRRKLEERVAALEAGKGS